MKIKLRIFIVVLTIIAALIICGVSILYRTSAASLKEEIYNHLATSAQSKANWISSYFEERRRDISNLAMISSVKQALKTGIFDFEKSSPSVEESRPDYLRCYKENCGYYDLFLITSDGNVSWTVAGESDRGTNLETGPYKDTSLAGVYREARKNGGIAISDYEYYEPSSEPAAFIAAPVYEENTLIGVVALQISTDQIDEIMRDRTGLGRTGETYLVGPDYLMRSNSRFFEESTILKQKVETENTRDCFANEAKGVEHTWHENIKIFPDYRGVRVLGTHIYIPELGWALLAEIDEKEALAPLRKLLWIFCCSRISFGICSLWVVGLAG